MAVLSSMAGTASPIDVALQQGLTLHQRGRLDEARIHYDLVLRAQPRHFAALHLLGVVAFQSNDAQHAVDLIDQALLVNPRSAAAHHDRANALLELGRHEAAIAGYDAALALTPGYADAHYNRGNALFDLGRHEAAVASYDEAIACQANHLLAFNNRGLALCALGQYDAALANFDHVLSDSPGNADSHHFRGNVLRIMRQHAAAIASYDRAITLGPGIAEIHNSRGSALAELEQYEAALVSYDRAIAMKPDFAEAHCNRANVLAGLEQWEPALAGYARAIAIRPEFAEAHFNLGNAHKELKQWNAALANYDDAIRVRADYAEAYCNRGLVRQQLGQFDAALASFDRAIALNPDYARAYVNRSMVSLLKGDFDRGWADYEWRWKLEDSSFIRQRRHFARPCWLGAESLVGRTLLVHSEQGFGDTLQFCRYVKWVADLGARVILEVQPPLMSLLATVEGAAQVVAPGGSPPEFDFYCPLMSLPWALKAALPAIPSQVPYLKSDPERIRFWRKTLGETRKPRVGLVWSGGVRSRQLEPWSVDERRNVPLAKFAPLRRPDIEFYTLQKGQPAESELADLAARHWDGPELVNFTHLLHDFADTAALMEHMDLIISVDTATAHLAGALGKPVWILNRFDTCWRWLLDRADSPWYPTARIYRQERPGDWESALHKVSRDLTMLLTHS